MMLLGETCGQNNADIMIAEHILQHCQLHDALRRDMWPDPIPLGVKLYGNLEELRRLLLLVGCLTSQQHSSVSQGRICSDNFKCCHTEIEVTNQTFHLTQSQYTDTGPTSPSADPITPGAWQGSHWSANFEVTGMTRPRKNPGASGIRTRDLPLSRRTPYHWAKEAVSWGGQPLLRGWQASPSCVRRQRRRRVTSLIQGPLALLPLETWSTSKSWLALNGIPYYEKPRSERSGGSWL